jgi:hypothetical protein
MSHDFTPSTPTTQLKDREKLNREMTQPKYSLLNQYEIV